MKKIICPCGTKINNSTGDCKLKCDVIDRLFCLHNDNEIIKDKESRENRIKGRLKITKNSTIIDELLKFD